MLDNNLTKNFHSVAPERSPARMKQSVISPVTVMIFLQLVGHAIIFLKTRS